MQNYVFQLFSDIMSTRQNQHFSEHYKFSVYSRRTETVINATKMPLSL